MASLIGGVKGDHIVLSGRLKGLQSLQCRASAQPSSHSRILRDNIRMGLDLGINHVVLMVMTSGHLSQ